MADQVSPEIVELATLQTNWQNQLIVTDRGVPRPLLANAITILRNAPEWQGVLRFNEFAGRVECGLPPPWASGDNQWTARAWESTDDLLAADWVQHAGVAVSPETTAQAVETVARDQLYHPVRDFLDGLVWDGQPRLDALATTYLGAEDSDYVRAVGARFLIAAVARIYEPGAKVDHVIILEGSQGTLKSTALRVLGDPWFSDEIADLGSKDASLQTRGVWIFEIAELDSMSRPEVSRIKAFLSRNVDRFRPPYGRRLIESPRQCVFTGTTNSDGYLRDETGGRRFWPIRCGSIDVDHLTQDRDQLWAEARTRYQAGAKWWLDEDDLINAAAAEQDARYAADPWTDAVLDHLSGRWDTSTAEVLRDAVGVPHERWNRSDEMRVAGILKKDGWHRYQAREGDKRRWRYRKPKNRSSPKS